ncbi:DNA/RNA non-specific endonuclease [Embleya sp. NBC_00896]|uniref:DNA/RNA non-specific endonuclease n=1 Tax=Embleya sp. NBC_00896 TaxID=2975961 RepID=UPI003864910E
MHRGHLLARQLGGNGKDVRNLVPLYAKTNTPHMSGFEDDIARDLALGDSIYFTSRPIYSGHSGIPDSIVITASGHLRTRHITIPNTPGR